MSRPPLSAFLLSLSLLVPARASALEARRTATIGSEDAAYSADPADFDAGSHHVVFTPVQAWVVAGYRPGGGFHGELAERWTVAADSRTWTFFLRPGMTFENDEPIKPEDILSSWTRLIRVLKAKGSRAEAFVDLVGYDDFPVKADVLEGFTHDERSITLRFSKPQAKLLADLSFGIYALAHPSLYDHNSGRWLDPKKVIASGPYRVREWNDRRMVLGLRKEYPAALRHPRPFEEIEVRWDAGALTDADLVWTSSEASRADKGYLFQGGEAPGVEYLRVESAKDPSSPLHDPAVRRALRAAFYEELIKSSPVRVDKSFYPLDMKGIRDPSDPPPSGIRVPQGSVLRFQRLTPPYSPKAEAVLRSITAAAGRLGFRFATVEVSSKEMIEAWISTATTTRWDIEWDGTRVDVNDPVGEMRFMVETKEGVCLPDPTGRAHAALKRASAEAQEFNQILWDDAIIWTMFHSHGGWWRKPDVDFSLFDSSADVPAVSMMGWRK